MREPLMSGHCMFPQTAHPEESHARCSGGNTANPAREFSPCPCPCHYPEDRYECECGGLLAEAPGWPSVFDEEGEPVTQYTHIDPRTGRATGEDCRAQ